MTIEFKLDERLKNDGQVIADLTLCCVILVDNANFPWIILIPKQNNLKEIIDLNQNDQIILMKEISYISKLVKELFHPDKLNIAALGNIVEQLHVHIIARFKNDISWPNPVFGKDKKNYNSNEYLAIINKLKEKINEEYKYTLV
jgi:diadenosine tetraphosphate (Ap4A) HIT family hydrolase